MKTITHRSAVDDITNGISKTWCGLTFSLYDENAPINNNPTCKECIEEIIKDRGKIKTESIDKYQ
jgi:hypothetical protein